MRPCLELPQRLALACARGGRWLVPLAPLLLTSCDSPHSPRVEASVASEVTASREPASSAPVLSPTAAVSPTDSTLGSPWGYAAALTVPSAAARRANSTALERYRAGHLPEAQQLWAQTLERDPDYDLARFNSACALVRLGQLAQSQRELEMLLARDLPRFLPRLLHDPDLEALRASDSGKRFVATWSANETQWLSLARRGLPVVAWVPHEPVQTAELTEGDHARPELLRPGVWLASERRFLPLGPETADALAAIVYPNEDRALVLRGHVDPCLFDMCPRLSTANVEVWRTLRTGAAGDGAPPAPPLQIRVADEEHIQTTLAAQLAGNTLRWLTSQGTWFEQSLQAGSPGRASPTQWQSGERLEAGTLGSLLEGLPPGWHAHDERLTTASGVVIELGKPFQGARLLVAEQAASGRAVVVGNWSGCICEEREEALLRHRIALANLSTGKLEPWLDGAGTAAVRIADAVYVQRGSTLTRFASLERSRSEKLPPGIVLTPPMQADGNCCGL